MAWSRGPPRIPTTGSVTVSQKTSTEALQPIIKSEPIAVLTQSAPPHGSLFHLFIDLIRIYFDALIQEYLLQKSVLKP